ncbi:MAG: membrane protein insertion efficiency factor YidD [Deltaproteobacteria bacterium]|nr:membrane protein insertion efficiency factor YidD [Deltaproteobacteria bacterium]MBW1960267.1 membrane protein insertion efficiency factor YidD [Deltaproteobacteria bacterium]MBW1993677.1 membrane protein insertion efficiency factor YidD [Deltaproteobacteria bacterium]MBW2150320.1 membrane protein insertion efficiency factor YidD [Deltaproteobacteria bacterium]
MKQLYRANRSNIICRIVLFAVLGSGLLVACYTPNSVKTGAKETFNPFSAAVLFYRGPLNHLSAVRIGECPMYPSDSEYSIQSFEKHGMLIGWIMTMDRLMRCGRDETKLSPRILVNGRWKTFDPLDNNDFWWSKTTE